MIRTIAWNISLVLLGVALGVASFEPCEPCDPCDTIENVHKEVEFLSDEAWYRNQKLIKQLEIEQENKYGV